MAEYNWQQVAGYALVVAVAAGSYSVAQIAIDSRRATLPAIEYFECLNKFQNYDWSKFSGETPPAGPTCKTLTGYRP